DSLSLRLPYSVKLATEYKSLTHYTKGTQSPNKVGSHCLYAYGFRFYFTPLSGALFAFPSRYWFTIGQSVVFSLGGWSPHLQTTFHLRRPTPFHFQEPSLYWAMTHYGRTFATVLLHSRELKGWFPFGLLFYDNFG